MKSIQIRNLAVLAMLCVSLLLVRHSSAAEFRAQGEGAGVRLIISQGGRDVTGKTVNVFAGQQIALTSSVTNGALVETPMWDVPGGDADRIANWTPTDELTLVTPLTVLNQISINFYFLKENIVTVKLKASVGGNALEGFVKFTVIKPAHSVNAVPGKVWARTVTARPEIELPAGKALGFGDFDAVEPDSPYGMEFTGILPNLYGGTAQFVQLLNSSVRTLALPEGSIKQVNVNIGSDGGYLYPSQIIAAGIYANDSPIAASISEDVSEYEREDSLIMYLMWTPPGGNSIPVSLEKIKWGWKGKASMKGGIWQLDSGSPTEIEQGDTDELPSWSAKADGPNWVTIPVN